MSNISITGNEAQFNENVTFLKNVNINGVLTLPSQEFTLNRLDVPDIRGIPNLSISSNSLQITGVTTFSDDVSFLGVVNFSQSLSFPDLVVRDKLQIGIGGTVFTADSRLNPGKVGIGSTQPTELLDVGGKAKILDLDLRNLNVSGFSTFVGITTQKSTLFATQLSASGISTFNSDVNIAGTASLIIDGTGPQSIFFKDNNADGIKLVYRVTSDQLRIEKQSDNNIFLAADRDGGQVELYNSNVKRLATTGVGITVFGDIIVPDVGIRTSRVGLGTTNAVYITDQLDDADEGPLRLAVDGSIAVTRNIYDSTGAPGGNNFFLKKVGSGIRWVPITPEFSEGIFLQNEGDEVPPAPGIAQSFTTLNFEQRNSFGTGTDNLTATAANPTTPNGLATVFTQDFWGFEGNDIYRMSNVGIGSAIPSVSLDVIGSTELQGNLNILGITTFSDDVEFHGVSGIASITFDKSDNSLKFIDNARLKFGNGNDLHIYHNGNNSFIRDEGAGSLKLQGRDVEIISVTDGSTMAKFIVDGAVNLHYGGTKRFATSGIGATVFGQLDTNDLNVTGVSTFVGLSTFANGIQVVSGIATFDGNIDANGDLDVDGHTELDNVNVSGVSTFKDDVEFHGASGIASITFDKSDNSLKFIDNAKLKFGDSGDLEIYHNEDHSIISDVGVGNLELHSSTVKIRNAAQTKVIFTAAGNAVKLFSDNSEKLSTTKEGIIVSGGTTTGTLSVTGVSTFVGLSTFNSNIFVEATTDTNQLNVSGISTFTNTVDLDGPVKDINDDIGFSNAVGVCKTDYRLSSVGTGVSWRPSGVQTKRTIWVSKNGCDTNSGLLEGDAKATIGAAASVAVETDTIKIRPGLYIEDNPIGLRTDVSITGEDIRLVTVQSKNTNKDIFHVRRGCLIENLNFGGSNVGVSHAGAACVAFPPPAGANSAITGYTEPGPATEGASGRWRSPYVRNCTNFMTDSIGLKVDGDHATASTVGADLKSMVVDSYTQYNENGIGVSLTNNGYAQLVSIFTISTDIGIFASSGAQCDLTNSNSSFGNFGLVAVGLGSTQFTGIVSNRNIEGDLIGSTTAEGQDTVVCADVRDIDGIERRPFDGQALFFKINLNQYPDVNTTGITTGIDDTGRITEPLQQLRSVNLIATGSDLEGFSAIDPPSVLIRDDLGEVEPRGPQGIIAEATADVDATGKLIGIDVIAQGRNYLSGQNIIVDIEGNTGLATAVMEPIFFTVNSSTENPIGSTGIATVTFNEFIPYELFPDDPFSLQRISRILTSSHSFEYVGAGTDINISTPLQGAIPIKANEIVAKDGAQIPFTSTDQQGNFDIGQGLQINQTTSSITGRDFSRSIQAQVTPLILALR